MDHSVWDSHNIVECSIQNAAGERDRDQQSDSESHGSQHVDQYQNQPEPENLNEIPGYHFSAQPEGIRGMHVIKPDEKMREHVAYGKIDARDDQEYESQGNYQADQQMQKQQGGESVKGPEKQAEFRRFSCLQVMGKDIISGHERPAQQQTAQGIGIGDGSDKTIQDPFPGGFPELVESYLQETFNGDAETSGNFFYPVFYITHTFQWLTFPKIK
jgi:hypothetical protein